MYATTYDLFEVIQLEKNRSCDQRQRKYSQQSVYKSTCTQYSSPLCSKLYKVLKYAIENT